MAFQSPVTKPPRLYWAYHSFRFSCGLRARFFELLPVWCVLERRVVLCERLFGLALGREHIAPRLQRIGPVRAFQVGVLEFRRRAREVPVLHERHAPGVITRGNAGRELYGLRVPFLRTRPVAAQIQNIAPEAVAIDERELADGTQCR